MLSENAPASTSTFPRSIFPPSPGLRDTPADLNVSLAWSHRTGSCSGARQVATAGRTAARYHAYRPTTASECSRSESMCLWRSSCTGSVRECTRSRVASAERTVCQRHIPAHVLRARHAQIFGRLRRVPVADLSRSSTSARQVRAVVVARLGAGNAPASCAPGQRRGRVLTSVWSRIVTSPEGEIPTHAVAGVEKHHQTTARRSKPRRDMLRPSTGRRLSPFSLNREKQDPLATPSSHPLVRLVLAVPPRLNHPSRPLRLPPHTHPSSLAPPFTASSCPSTQTRHDGRRKPHCPPALPGWNSQFMRIPRWNI